MSHDHIDTLLTFGLADQRLGPMRWMDPAIESDPDWVDVHAAGCAWGPVAVELAERYGRCLTASTADRVGAVLLAENARSVGHRYDEDALAVELEQAGLYRFRALDHAPHPLVVLNAVGGLVYQSCEHPGWDASEAHAICEAMRLLAIGRLPGIDDAPGWSVHDRGVWKWRPAAIRV